MNETGDSPKPEVSKEAEKVVRDKVSYLKESILAAAKDEAIKRDPENPIVTRDDALLAIAALGMREEKLQIKAESSRRRIFQSSLFAATFSMLALMAAAVSILSGELDQGYPLVLIFMLATLAAAGAVASALIIQISRKRTQRARLRDHDLELRAAGASNFLMQWVNIEKKIRSSVEGHRGQNLQSAPFPRLLSAYSEIPGVSENQIVEIVSLLKARNNIVHGIGRYSKNEIIELIQAANKLSREISH